MPTIHPTAIIDPTAHIADTAHIGPYCIIGPSVSIGERTAADGDRRGKRPGRVNRALRVQICAAIRSEMANSFIVGNFAGRNSEDTT